MREGGKTVAAGVITKLFQDPPEDIKEEEERAAKSKAAIAPKPQNPVLFEMITK